MPYPPSDGSSTSNAAVASAASTGARRCSLTARRLIGAYALPVTTMAWLGTVLVVAIGLAIVVGGVAAGPMARMMEKEAATSWRPPTATDSRDPADGMLRVQLLLARAC
jgi:hypothetical protein